MHRQAFIVCSFILSFHPSVIDPLSTVQIPGADVPSLPLTTGPIVLRTTRAGGGLCLPPAWVVRKTMGQVVRGRLGVKRGGIVEDRGGAPAAVVAVRHISWGPRIV